MPDLPSIRAVVFDLDGLMFNTEDIFNAVGHEVCRRRGKEMTLDLLQQMMGRRAPEAIALMIEYHQWTDTVEGLTDVHDIVAAIVRAALADEALATGLRTRIAEMQDRLVRLPDCAVKRRQIAKDVMLELDIKKITAPDFTASVRPGMPALLVLDEAAVPSIYWQPVAPKLNRQGLLSASAGKMR